MEKKKLYILRDGNRVMAGSFDQMRLRTLLPKLTTWKKTSFPNGDIVFKADSGHHIESIKEV